MKSGELRKRRLALLRDQGLPPKPTKAALADTARIIRRAEDERRRIANEQPDDAA